VRRQPGALPLLQHALLELWKKREGRRLTVKAYQEIGKLEGALQRRADPTLGATVSRPVLKPRNRPGLPVFSVMQQKSRHGEQKSRRGLLKAAALPRSLLPRSPNILSAVYC